MATGTADAAAAGAVTSDSPTAPDSPAAWAGFTTSRFLALDIRVISGSSLRVAGEVSSTSSLRLIHMRSSAHVIERSQMLIERDATDGLLIGLCLRGRVTMAYHGLSTVATPWHLSVSPLDRPFMAVFDDDTEGVGAIIPRRLFAAATGSSAVDAFTRGHMEANPFAAGFSRRLLDATATGDASAITDTFLIETLRGMLATPEDRPGDHFAAAQRYIDANIDDAALAAPKIGAAIGISQRHLSRVFGEAGVSVPQFVRQRRLATARALIEESTSTTTVAEVARRAGFASPGYFATSFASAYGVQPREAIRNALIGRPIVG